jgi:hypothetical protein
VREIRLLAARHSPSVLCVVETQLHKARVEGLSRTLGFNNCFAVSSSGRSGSFGIFWNNAIKVEILPYYQYHIDTIISSIDMAPWRLTCVYGEAQVSERYKTWDMLKFIKSSTNLPWMCIGDFNEVLHRREHVGVTERSSAQIAAFGDTIDVCGLANLGYVGLDWTFEKRVAGGSYSRTRLDRALASPCWSNRYPLAMVEHLTAVTLDHSPIILRMEPAARRPPKKGRMFRYELMWEAHEEFAPVLKKTWHEVGNISTKVEMKEKLSYLSENLKEWETNNFGSVRKTLQKLKGELEGMRADPGRTGPSYEIKVRERIAELHHR